MNFLGIRAIKEVRRAYQRYQQAIYTIIDLFNFSLGIIFIMKGCQKQCLKQFVIQSIAKDLGNTLYAIEILSPYGRLNDKIRLSYPFQ